MLTYGAIIVTNSFVSQIFNFKIKIYCMGYYKNYSIIIKLTIIRCNILLTVRYSFTFPWNFIALLCSNTILSIEQFSARKDRTFKIFGALEILFNLPAITSEINEILEKVGEPFFKNRILFP